MRKRSLTPIRERTEPISSSSQDNTSSTIKTMTTKMQAAVHACQIGDIETVKVLLNGQVSVDELDVEGCGMMHWAAINDKVDIIRLLISRQANIDIIGGNMKATPLHWACYNSQLGAVVTLATMGANPVLKNTNGETALHVAAHTGNTQVIAYLLAKFEAIRDWRDNLGRSALMLATKSGFGLFPIRVFTKFDVFLDFTDDETGDTALHIAIARQNLNGAVELICSGADETKKNKLGMTPIELADDEMEKHVLQQVATRNVRESGDYCEKVSSRWFLTHFFSASITLILLLSGLGLYYLAGFWTMFSFLLVSMTTFAFLCKKIRIDQMALLPVTYIFWMGQAELALLIFDSDGFIHWSLLMVMCTIWIVSASFYWLLILSDPGVIPRNEDPFPSFLINMESYQMDRFCFTCWIPKTPTSHHCSMCDKCVDGFDHHCPWIHKCVYRKNLRCFVLFCFTNFLFDLFYCPVLLYMVCCSFDSVGFQRTLDERGIHVVSFGLSVLHVLGAGTITYTQFSQISRHVSTIEIIRKRQQQKSDSEKSSQEDEDYFGRKLPMSTKVQNVCNLLIFDKFGEEDSYSYSQSTTTSATSTTV